MPRIGSLLAGARGIDANTRLTPDDASAFAEATYRFIIRYVRRSTAHAYDISASEMQSILGAGLGLMLVQHVAAENWRPFGSLGATYGATAATEAARVGYAPGAHLWCDLEGVAPGVPTTAVIEYCNAWYDAVDRAGYRPGLYVGWHAGLGADDLYWKLRFASFWGSYNLDRENIPAVRGLCMQQGAYPAPSQRVAGIAFEYDTDVIKVDANGDTPTLMLP